jgi:hypothetical protein
LEPSPISPGLQGLLDLLNAPTKRAAKKLCRELVIERTDFFDLIMAGREGGLAPYLYACHFANHTPPHVPPTPEQMTALAEHGGGVFTGQAKRAITRVFQSMEERRLFAAHLFYLPENNFWSLFYFDQRDQSGRNNHWGVGGPHIHYASEAFTQVSLMDVWQSICQLQPRPPSGEHIRFRDPA